MAVNPLPGILDAEFREWTQSISTSFLVNSQKQECNARQKKIMMTTGIV